MANERLLVSTTRHVPSHLRDAYRKAWMSLEAAVREAGGNAWRFQSATEPDRHIEFIEYKGSDPRAHPAAAIALQRLDAAHTGRTDEWRPADDDTPPPLTDT